MDHIEHAQDAAEDYYLNSQEGMEREGGSKDAAPISQQQQQQIDESFVTMSMTDSIGAGAEANTSTRSCAPRSLQKRLKWGWRNALLLLICAHCRIHHVQSEVVHNDTNAASGDPPITPATDSASLSMSTPIPMAMAMPSRPSDSVKQKKQQQQNMDEHEQATKQQLRFHQLEFRSLATDVGEEEELQIDSDSSSIRIDQESPVDQSKQSTSNVEPERVIRSENEATLHDTSTLQGVFEVCRDYMEQVVDSVMGITQVTREEKYRTVVMRRRRSDPQKIRRLRSSDDSKDSHSSGEISEDNVVYGYCDPECDDDFYKYIETESQLPKLFPLDSHDIIGFMLASLGVTLGAASGIGGGGIVVPVYIIAMNLPPRFAIPLGSATVFGGSLAGLLINLKRRHPLADRPLIDWDLILVMEPLVLVGVLIGGVFHRMIGEQFLIVLLVLFLSVSAHTTLAKAKRMHEAEERYIQHLRAIRQDAIMRMCSFKTTFRTSGWSNEAMPGGTVGGGTATEYRYPDSIHMTRTMSLESKTIKTISPTASRIDGDEKQRILILNPDFVTLRSDLMEQEKATPRSKIIVLFCKFSVLMFLNIKLGGGDEDHKSSWGIECGSVAFWVVHIIMIAFLIASAWAAQTYLINRHEIKEIVNYDYVQGDIKWEPRNAVIYPSFFIGAGISAGCFGIGGGLITVPVMLAMGVHPAVVSATTSTMVFFSGALSASSFAIFGLLLWDYGTVCLFMGFFASLVGTSIMSRAKKSRAGGANFERNSIIAYSVGGVILLSALLMTVQYALNGRMYDTLDDGESNVNEFCQGYRL